MSRSFRQINDGRIHKVHDVDIDHECQQQGHPHGIDAVLPLGRDAAAQDQLGQDKEDAPAVQGREGKEVQDAEADGENADQLKREVGGRLWRSRLGCRSGGVEAQARGSGRRG